MATTSTTTERVGRYQLLEPIGVGCSGAVWRAKVFGVAGFERQFAVKKFSTELTQSTAMAQALSAAARAYGSLEHPRIARMSEFGVAQGVTFTAVELVPGLDVLRMLAEAKLAGAALAPGGTLTLISQAARAVGYAHGRGLTHLGLAPTNVIVTPDGDVKITDFGILAATLPAKPIDVPRLANRIPYLAPEQIAGEATSAATDVFCLGVIAYELITGARAFPGDKPAQVAAAIVAGPPPEPPLPRPIVRVLQRCLARSPFERFPDARALADALDAALRVAPVPGTRKDIGAQVADTMARLAALNEGGASGMVALHVGTGPMRKIDPAQLSPHETPTHEFVRPDLAVPGPTPLVAPKPISGPIPTIPSAPTPTLVPGAARFVPGAGSTDPDGPIKAPMSTVPGIAPPPGTPSPIGPSPSQATAPPAAPAPSSTLFGIPPVKPPTAGPGSKPAIPSIRPAMPRAPGVVPPVPALRPPTVPPPMPGMPSGLPVMGRVATKDVNQLPRLPSMGGFSPDATSVDEPPTTPRAETAGPTRVDEAPTTPRAETSAPTRVDPLQAALRSPTQPPLPRVKPATIDPNRPSEPSIDLVLESDGEVDAATSPKIAAAPRVRDSVDLGHVVGRAPTADEPDLTPLPAPEPMAPDSDLSGLFMPNAHDAITRPVPPIAPSDLAADAGVLPLPAPLLTPLPMPSSIANAIANAQASAPPVPLADDEASPPPLAVPPPPLAPIVPGPPVRPSAPSKTSAPEISPYTPYVVEPAAPAAKPRAKWPWLVGGVVGLGVLGFVGFEVYQVVTEDADVAAPVQKKLGAHPIATAVDAGAPDAAAVAMHAAPVIDAEVKATPVDAIAPDAPIAIDAPEAKPAAIDAGAPAIDAGAAPIPPVSSGGDKGSLVIDSTPHGAHVFLDGSDVGVTPAKLPGTADRHNIALLLPGHDLYVAQVDGHGTFTIPLKEITPPGGPAGIKVIKCKEPNRYYVFVDGKPTGMMCPTERIETTVGAHTVEVYDAGTEQRRKFDIVVNDTRLSYRVRIE